MINLYPIAVTTHITGLSIMAGTTVAAYVMTKQFWLQYDIDPSKAIAINNATSKLARLSGIGAMLLILSGLTMMVITSGAFGKQIWFQIKFGLVIIVILNAVIVGRRMASRLNKFLSEERNQTNVEKRLSTIKSNITQYYISQMIFFIIIFTLSVFKFN